MVVRCGSQRVLHQQKGKGTGLLGAIAEEVAGERGSLGMGGGGRGDY